ncbi:hypothetical protein V8C37DRAFT_395930 [Trichoderma ceciliae]
MCPHVPGRYPVVYLYASDHFLLLIGSVIILSSSTAQNLLLSLAGVLRRLLRPAWRCKSPTRLLTRRKRAYNVSEPVMADVEESQSAGCALMTWLVCVCLQWGWDGRRTGRSIDCCCMSEGSTGPPQWT